MSYGIVWGHDNGPLTLDDYDIVEIEKTKRGYVLTREVALDNGSIHLRDQYVPDSLIRALHNLEDDEWIKGDKDTR